MKNIRSILDWSTPNLLSPSLLLGWQMEKRLPGSLGEILCFAPVPHSEQFQPGLFISMVKRLFLSFPWPLPRVSHFSVFLWKMEKDPLQKTFLWPLLWVPSQHSQFPGSSAHSLCISQQETAWGLTSSRVPNEFFPAQDIEQTTQPYTQEKVLLCP